MHRTPLSTATSAALFADACAVIPGGVNSPVRAFSSVGGTPRFITSASGYWLTDADGNEYVDLVCSWGPLILGHAHPAAVDAVQRAVAAGTSFGTPSAPEVESAEEIVSRTPACGLSRAGGRPASPPLRPRRRWSVPTTTSRPSPMRSTGMAPRSRAS